MYEYWTKISTEEHRIYSKEFAHLISLYTMNGSLHYKLAHYVLSECEKELSKKEYYYLSKNGMKRVFDNETIQKAVHFLHTNTSKNGLDFIFNDGKRKFNYKSSQ